MATNSLQSLHHHHSLRRRHSIDSPPTTVSSSSSSSSSLFLKPTPTTTPATSSLSQSLSFTPLSLSSATSTPFTSQTISFDLLKQHLSAQNFRQADEETRRLLIALAGEPAQKRGYVFFSEVQFISESDLRTIDELWREHSSNKFGYSVQKKIWKKSKKDFSTFFIKVGWMKKLDTEIVQYNYRSFPTEFVWENTEDTPVGHLPLTNALRGTQLLTSILIHPAFEDEEEDGEERETDEERGSGNGGLKGNSKPLNKSTLFKPNYSF